MMKLRHKSGYSLVELSIVFVIFGFLISIGVTTFRKYLNQQGMNTATEHIVTLLNRARSYTLGSFDDSGGTERNYGVHIDVANDTLTLFFSTKMCAPFDPGPPGNTVIQPERIIQSIDISAINISAGSDIVFQRISGDAKAANGGCVALPAGGGTITLQSRSGGGSKTIRISDTGIISIE